MILNPFVEQREYVEQVESDDDDDDVGYLDYDEDDYNESGLYDEYDMSDNEYWWRICDLRKLYCVQDFLCFLKK